ncbi:MAG: prepilin-type N-terminal cleavage/methylation domain-containing protein [Alphaproteobacteria bacterium]|nr:prepilin-type N-terminal cleavage/methylation domain-containing protein [Alphaproteobacteria bacterium]MBV9967167.1 prepilin-type N-terminal cleavage/methylation domain-containing protein [Alphaproteobacteria bacterium]
MTHSGPPVGSEGGRAGGFTLLEVVVALTVLGFLIIGLNAGVRTGLGIWHRQTRQMTEVAEVATTARVLRVLLAGIPVASAANIERGAPLAISFGGTADRLRFVGDLPDGLGLARRAEITLALKDDRLVLSWIPRRFEQAGPPPSPTDAELTRGVTRLTFAYFGAPQPGEPSRWLARWDGPALPELIRVQVSFEHGDTRHWPDLIVAPQLAAPEG